uniref:Uncharacterized protein n=1 Tax=Heterosigma akashiwo TaxID=2829 RepID=A0A7S3Y827_HETAK
MTHPGRPAGPPGAVRFAGETLALDLGPGEWLAGALELRVVRQEPLLPHRLLGRATAPLANVGLLQPAQGASMETTCLPLRQGGTEEPGGAQLLVCMNLVLSPELSNRAWELGDADALKQDLLEKLQGKADGKSSMMPPPQSVGPRLFVQPPPPALPPRRRPSAARDENGKDQIGNLHLQSTANLPASSEKDAGLSQAATLLTSLVEDFERFACGSAPPEPPGRTLARLRGLAALLPSTGRAMAEGGGGNSGAGNSGGGGGRQRAWSEGSAALALEAEGDAREAPKFLMATREFMGMGFCSRSGGFGLLLDKDLQSGSTQPCQVYGMEPLVESEVELPPTPPPEEVEGEEKRAAELPPHPPGPDQAHLGRGGGGAAVGGLEEGREGRSRKKGHGVVDFEVLAVEVFRFTHCFS